MEVQTTLAYKEVPYDEELTPSNELEKNGGIRVAHVTEAPMAGVFTYLQEVISYQVEATDITALHVLLPDSDAPRLRQLAFGKVEIHSFRRKGRSALSMMGFALTTMRFLKHSRPDIVPTFIRRLLVQL